MTDRYWEGHRDGGLDMRERYENDWRKADKAEIERLRSELDMAHKANAEAYDAGRDSALDEIEQFREIAGQAFNLIPTDPSEARRLLFCINRGLQTKDCDHENGYCRLNEG